MRTIEERNAIVVKNLPLAYWAVQRFASHYPTDPEDLAQIAMVGLIKAAATWDATKSKFSVWATWQMRGELTRWAEAKRSRGVTLFFPEMQDMPAERDDTVETNDELEWVYRQLSSLPAPERQVIRARLSGLSHTEIAFAYGFSKQRANQLYDKAIERLQEAV